MENVIKSVELTIYANDGRTKRIPLEVWQVGIISQMLGLQVKFPDLDYEMSGKDRVDERMAVYIKAVKTLCSENPDCR